MLLIAYLQQLKGEDEMDLGLQGKSVIVTAASKGLGKAIAKEFAAEGAHVLISSRNEEELKKQKMKFVRKPEIFTSNMPDVISRTFKTSKTYL